MGRATSLALSFGLLFAVAGCAQPAQDGTEPALEMTREGAAPEEALVEGLREGGYPIYFRHAATEPDGVNGVETLGDRGLQRNLSGEGREQSQMIGEVFRELDIPVGEVLSSPYFRNTDTAEVAFGRFQPAEELLGLLSVWGEREERNRQFLRDQLSAPSGEEGDTVLLSHTSNLEEVDGVTLEAGEAAVYEPLRDGEFELRARLMPEGWDELAENS